MMMKELLTASRMAALLACPRKHFWRYELGLRRTVDADALRFGSAWHLAMEARWKGADVSAAFAAAVADKTDLDEVQLATLSGMLAGYYTLYASDPIKSVHPEVEFRYPLAGSRTFESAGKIDGLAVMHDGRLALVEHKTAGCDIAPDSDYWLRLRGNAQVMQYVLAARALGWDVALVIYDVARKPSIRQKQEETPDQFGDRLGADTKERPEFYFARREVPILENDLAEFEVQRQVLARQILACRGESRRASRAEHGWPRNVGEMTCKFCDYAGFCLQNTAVNVEQPPAGFVVGEIHGELGG
jgi:hypothetical protein